MLSYLILGITYGFAAAATPGPLCMYLISQSITAGWRRTIPAAFSPLVSDVPVAILVLTALSQAPSGVVQYLRLIGGLFILYLAFEAWQAWRNFEAQRAVPLQSSSSSLWKAAIVNWLNPNPYLGWSIVLGPVVLSGWRQSPEKGVALLLAFYITMIGTMIAMVVLFAAAKAFGPKVRRSLIGLSSIGLAGLGVYQLWLGLLSLIAK